MTSAKGASHEIRLAGDYDLSRKDEVSTLFNALDGDGAVVIDMTDVTYIDSSILNEFAVLRLRDENRSITLRRVSKSVRRILQIVSFDRIFTLTE